MIHPCCHQHAIKIVPTLINRTLQEYDQNKILGKVPKKPGQVHYLSRQPVLREDKKTTKIRAVFDASEGPSLNDCYIPVRISSQRFFLRFLFNFIAILADIKQTFLNIQILKERRDFLRFLWFKNVPPKSDVKLVVFRFLRVVFGATSSPFLLNVAIRHHLSKYLSCDQQFT